MENKKLSLIKLVFLISLAFILFSLPSVSADYRREVYDYQGSHTSEKVNYSLINADTISGGNGTFTENVTVEDSIIAGYFYGMFNWSTLGPFISFANSILSFSSSELNDTLTHHYQVNRSEDVTFDKNIDAYNMSVASSGYFKGQPLDGALDSGIIWAETLDENANINLTHTASSLDIAYPNMIVRIVNTTNDVKYCNITGATATVTDEQHSVYYVDNNCAVQSIAIATYIATDLSPGGITEIFNAMAHSGDIEVHQGAPIQSKINIKTRKASFSVAHLRTVSGMRIITEGFSNFTISSGEYIFINDVMDITVQNMTNGSKFEVVYKDGGDWIYNEYEDTTQTGLNLTSCDDGTDVVTCALTNRFRRYFIFMTGFADGDDETEVHQRLADVDTSYTNVGACLDTTANPVSYSIPDVYTYTAGIE